MAVKERAASKDKMRKKRIEVFVPEVLLKDGDGLEEFGVEARVLELPGHTAGPIGLDVSGKAVLVGPARNRDWCSPPS